MLPSIAESCWCADVLVIGQRCMPNDGPSQFVKAVSIDEPTKRTGKKNFYFSISFGRMHRLAARLPVKFQSVRRPPNERGFVAVGFVHFTIQSKLRQKNLFGNYANDPTRSRSLPWEHIDFLSFLFLVPAFFFLMGSIILLKSDGTDVRWLDSTWRGRWCALCFPFFC